MINKEMEMDKKMENTPQIFRPDLDLSISHMLVNKYCGHYVIFLKVGICNVDLESSSKI